jgi:hypothetical protein
MDTSSQLHVPAVLLPGKESRSLDRRFGGQQIWRERCSEKCCALSGIKSRFSCRPAQSLVGLSTWKCNSWNCETASIVFVHITWIQWYSTGFEKSEYFVLDLVTVNTSRYSDVSWCSQRNVKSESRLLQLQAFPVKHMELHLKLGKGDENFTKLFLWVVFTP